jgi:Domain of unknown function (DUF4349)
MRLTDEQIGAELRALRETPSEDFAAELDAWAAEGFPSAKDLDRPKAGRHGFRSFIGQRPILAGLAGSAVTVMVVGVSVAAYLKGNDTSGPLGASGDDLGVVHESGELSGQGAPAKSRLQEQAPGVAAEPLIAPAPPTGSRPRIGRPQVQELSASLGLSTDKDQLQAAADGVVEVTNRYDGFVDASDVRVGGRQSLASFSLRIPAADLRAALDDLSQLGRVVLRDEASANVTGAYVDAGKAHREAQAKVDSLLAQLRDASSPSEAADIRQQLVVARQQLAAARDALRGMKQRVTYAPVSVQIRADGDGSWSIGDAADDAVGVLEATAGAALIALAVLVPIAALLILGWLGGREFSRRRRETALDR